jgi:hypothetical protein
MRLQIGESSNAVYVHVASLHDHPKFFKSQADFDRYLRETGNKVLSNDSVKLSDPDAAYREFAKLTADKWWWKVLPDNCATFAVAIIRAGGGNFDVRLNCPNQAFVQSLGAAMERSLPLVTVTM